MKCRNWIERLPSLLDEDPRSPGRRGLEAHLSQCGKCRGQWALLDRLKEAAADLDGQDPDESVWLGIQKELAGQDAKKPSAEARRGPMVRLMLGWAGALATALVVAIWLWPQKNATKEPYAGKTQPLETAAIAPEPAAKAPANPAPVPRAGSRPRPAVRRGTPPAREQRYLIDDLASADDAPARDTRVQYMLPLLVPADIGATGNDQQYIMPAVHAAVREPF